ncbi:MAG: TIGR03749 family integrating conjugative element protein [Geminicoccaceae bacterium]
MIGRLIVAWCLLIIVATTTCKADGHVETVRWDRKPITLSLPIGQERYVWFPGRVQPGVPPELTGKLRVQAVNDTIYLMAKQPFSETRLPVRSIDDGRFFLFDIRTDVAATTNPIRVVESIGRDEQSLVSTGLPGSTNQIANYHQDGQGSGYVDLTRFAAQQIHAPARLAQQVPGISSAPLPVAGNIVALYRGGVITANPVASWLGRGGLYVTAVTVVNATDRILTLDPRLARGDWLTATFHHQKLGPKGQPDDTSTLYLISDRPFLEATQS